MDNDILYYILYKRDELIRLIKDIKKDNKSSEYLWSVGLLHELELLEHALESILIEHIDNDNTEEIISYAEDIYTILTATYSFKEGIEKWKSILFLNITGVICNKEEKIKNFFKYEEKYWDKKLWNIVCIIWSKIICGLTLNDIEYCRKLIEEIKDSKKTYNNMFENDKAMYPILLGLYRILDAAKSILDYKTSNNINRKYFVDTETSMNFIRIIKDFSKDSDIKKIAKGLKYIYPIIVDKPLIDNVNNNETKQDKIDYDEQIEKILNNYDWDRAVEILKILRRDIYDPFEINREYIITIFKTMADTLKNYPNKESITMFVFTLSKFNNSLTFHMTPKIKY